MRALVQRVRRATVYLVADPPGAASPAESGGSVLGQIGPGLAVLVGVRTGDTLEDARHLAGRVATLRIFDDEAGRMNRSVLDVGGVVLSVPQFTLYADTRRGRRPSFVDAAPPDLAERLYEDFNAQLTASGVPVVSGKFRARMIVEIHNDGPVTILLDVPER